MLLFKKKIFYTFLFILPLIHCPIFSKQKFLINSNNKDPKVLILIIASDNYPGLDLTFPYAELKKIWRSYMHSNPDNIEAYFIQGDPNLASAYEIQEDIIWCKTEENVMPGILNKTLLAIECMIPRIGEFDYILRPNLSSFYVFPRFLQFLKTLPRNGCYCGYDQGGYATGCGYLMSSDVAEYLVINQDKLKQAIDVNKTYDDVALGEFFKISNIALIPAPRRDLCNIRDWLKYKKIKSTSHFHFRVKNNEHKLRATVDVHILNSLLQQFYGLPSKKYSLEKNKNEKGRNKVEE